MGGGSQRSPACAGRGFSSTSGGRYRRGSQHARGTSRQRGNANNPDRLFCWYRSSQGRPSCKPAHPGGNVTGVTVLNVGLFAKSIDLMHSLMAPSTTIAVLINPANAPQSATERDIVRDVGCTLDAHFVILNASSSSEIESAFATIASERIGALVVSGENFFLTQRNLLVTLAAHHAVPTIYPYHEFVLAGGFMSYGTHYVDAFRQVGANTGRIQLFDPHQSSEWHLPGSR
jgi:ABC-type uncharacterized transport system substrate-binding protein